MEIQQQDGVVVEAAGFQQGFAKRCGRRDSSLAAPFLGGRGKAVPPSPLALYIVGGREGNHT